MRKILEQMVGALIMSGIPVAIEKGPIEGHTKGTGYLDKDLAELLGDRKAVLFKKGFHGHDCLVLGFARGATSVFSRYGGEQVASGGTDLLTARIGDDYPDHPEYQVDNNICLMLEEFIREPVAV